MRNSFWRSYAFLPSSFALFSFFFIAGCGSDNFQFNQDSTTENFNQQSSIQKNPLDILFVVDNSSSMSDLQTNLTNNFSSFISSFVKQGYDFHIAVTTTEAYLSEAVFDNNPLYAQFKESSQNFTTGVFVVEPTTPNLDSVFVTNADQGDQGSGDERAFSSLRDALSSPQNSGFLRNNSFLAVIVLSDEDDFSGAARPEYSWESGGGVPDHDYKAPTLDSVDSYVSFLDSLTQSTGSTRRWNFSTISVDTQACQTSRVQISSSAIIGQRYMQLTKETNGTIGSICDASFANTLTSISNQIATLSTQFYLSRVPQVSTIVVKVNGAVVPENPINGWIYNSATNSIQFHGAAVPGLNASISVTFLPDLSVTAGT